MRPYCEIMVLEIFPQIRALIARELIENLGFTQNEAALKMGLTQPAISQYQKEMRATKIKVLEKYPQIMDTIRDSAKSIAKSKDPSDFGILCNICRKIRETDMLSEIHKKPAEYDDCKSSFCRHK